MNQTEPIDVRVINHPKPRNYQVRGAYRSVVLTAANPYQQIAGPDPLRKHITMGPAVQQVSQTTLDNTGSVTSPGAGATIAQVSLPGPGTYTVSWSVELSGTLAAADANNFQLFQSGTGANFAVLTAENQAAAGQYPQTSVTITTKASDNFIKIITIGAGTVGAVYAGSLVVQQIPNPNGSYVVSGSVSQASDPNNAASPVTQPNGRLIPINTPEVKIEGNQDVWVSASQFPTIVGYTIVREVPENG
jgi:hypothetical protein